MSTMGRRRTGACRRSPWPSCPPRAGTGRATTPAWYRRSNSSQTRDRWNPRDSQSEGSRRRKFTNRRHGVHGYSSRHAPKPCQQSTAHSSTSWLLSPSKTCCNQHRKSLRGNAEWEAGRSPSCAPSWLSKKEKEPTLPRPGWSRSTRRKFVGGSCQGLDPPSLSLSRHPDI